MTNSFNRRDFLQGAASTAGVCLLGALRAWPLQNDNLGSLPQNLPQWMRQNHVPGVAVAIVRNAEPDWLRGFGMKNAEKQEPADENTVFEAASLSKPVFAYALLTLVAEGKFDLDRPLTSYLQQPFRSRVPRLMVSSVPDDPRLKRITPRIVLSHSTGFPNWGRGKPLKLEFDPGSKFGYSGEGYVYLQNVVEHVTGEPLDVFARERVFAPLEMAGSNFIWRQDYEQRAAIGYDIRGARPKDKPRQAIAAATLHTTATDFAKFLGAILTPKRGTGLNDEWLKRMLTPTTKIDDSLAWGLGWGLEPSPASTNFWQWGDNGEFKAFAMGCRETKQAVAIFTNGANGLRVCRSVVEAVLPGKHPALSFGMLSY